MGHIGVARASRNHHLWRCISAAVLIVPSDSSSSQVSSVAVCPTNSELLATGGEDGAYASILPVKTAVVCHASAIPRR